MTHTPGPWRLVKDDYIMSHKGLLIGQICSEDATDMDANARLIAAAPDLLAALKLAADIIGADDRINPILDAISKAEGQ
jgi:Trm5-related predicted tRNA methylase